MLTFMHTYTPSSWEGLIKKGLWRKGDGLKLMHKTYFPPEKRFNRAADTGSRLFAILKEERCPFYIDRLQGGIPMPEWYDYDPALLKEYRDLLGGNFLGFQMHEWASNLRDEGLRVKAAADEWKTRHPDAPEEIFWREKVTAARTDPMALFVEACSVGEWSEMTHPVNACDFLSRARMLWARRMQMTGGPLFPADSFFMAPKIEIAGGAKMLLPEIGWQIAGTRFQIAYTRGMAKAAGIPWGTYYECWCDQGNGLTIPYAADTAENEWDETDLLREMTVRTGGNTENGGSSRSLQERSWLYSYFSGASVMGEEYGVCSTFRNDRDFELSGYGEVKKRFLDFASENPDIGVTYTPFAVVLPAETEIYSLCEGPGTYLKFPLDGTPLDGMEKGFADKIRFSRLVIGQLLYGGGPEAPLLGNEARCIQNGAFPDVFDVIHGDMPGALAGYPYLIDLTGDRSFALRHSGRIVPPERVAGLLPELLPFTLTGGAHCVFNRRENAWLALVMNNNGVVRRDYRGDRFLPEAEIVSELVPGRAGTPDIRKTAGSGRLLREDGAYRLKLGAGQWVILSVSVC